MTQIEDPYIWMENLEDKRVIEFIDNENKRLRSFLGDLPSKIEPRVKHYFMKPYVLITRVTDIGYFYLVREGKANKIKLRKKNGEIVELVNSEELGKDIVLNYFVVSRDGKRLAYYFSYAGADEGTVRIIDVESMNVIDELRGSIGNIIWLDKESYYYVRFYRKGKTPDGIQAPTSRIFLRMNGSEEMVFGYGIETSHFISLGASTDLSRALITVSYGWTKSMAYGGNLRKPEEWHLIYGAKDSIVYPVDYIREKYILISYEDEGLGKIISINRMGEREILIDEQEFPLQTALIVNERIVAHYLVHASSILKIFDLNGKLVLDVKFDVPGSVSSMHTNGKELIFKFETFFIPYRIYRLMNDKLELLESEEIKGDYIIEEDFATSYDKTRIHLFIVRKKNIPIRNVILFGYGGFRIAITPSYTPFALPFIDDGGVYAVANIRGGSEYGERWHREGMREKKQNVFNDFIAAITYFKTKGARVAAIGRSNGGLLVGAVLTQRPEILDCAIIGYPVLDMLRFHKLYIGRAWVPEYGDPDNPEDAKYLLKYSPYHNIRNDVNYPPTLVYTGLHDDRVHPAHAFKFVARMKDAEASIYLRTETVSGHAGATPETRVKEYADILAFIYKVLEIKKL